MNGRLFPPTIRQLLSPRFGAESRLEVTGWIKSVRRQKNVSFAVVNDGSCSQGLQAVFLKDRLPNALTNGAAVRLLGRLMGSPGPGQDKEFRVEDVTVVGECSPSEYPIQKQSLTNDYLRDQCHLRARVDNIGQMLRVRDRLTRSIHSFFEDQGFTHVHTPVLTSNDCEGAGETFSVLAERESGSHDTSHFFRQPAYLTVSSQLHLEALATARSRVYTLAPCFRAERSQTNRHLAEFWMLEAEWTFTRCVEDICRVVEEMTKAACKSVQEEVNVDGDLMAMNRRWTRLSYKEAIRELEIQDSQTQTSSRFAHKPQWGKPLQSEHEKWLAQAMGGPVFVTDYPKTLKPFYMRLNDDEETVACFDLLVPRIGELVGGSLREERLELLDDAISRHGLKVEDYEWYRDLRRFGGAPHGGFGLGLERLVSVVTGIENVRECIPMPRWAGRMLL